jgi:ECF sigma factor
LSTKTAQLEWRRNKVIELRATGLSYQEIAQHLQVSKASITSDVQYLREQAKQSIKEYTTERLPEQYHICMTALDTVLKNAFVIMTQSHDNREKLQALSLFKETHLEIIALQSNATTIDSALSYIRSKQSQQHKKDSDDDNGYSSTRITSTTPTTAGKQTVF